MIAHHIRMTTNTPFTPAVHRFKGHFPILSCDCKRKKGSEAAYKSLF